jgi:hypothetical protein
MNVNMNQKNKCDDLKKKTKNQDRALFVDIQVPHLSQGTGVNYTDPFVPGAWPAHGCRTNTDAKDLWRLFLNNTRSDVVERGSLRGWR